MENLIEKLKWIDETLKNLEKSKDKSLDSLKNSLRREQEKIVSSINNLKQDIKYSTNRIDYYTFTLEE